MPALYSDLNTYFRRLFGCRVQKISVDAGLTCPNRDGTLATGGCIYCNARGSGTGASARGLGLTEQIAQSKRYLARRYKAQKFLVYFQSFTNTYAPVPTLRKLYDDALADQDVVGLSIGTRPDCVDEAVLALLEEYARNRLIWIEYGLQSIHDATLRRINRGHGFAAFERAVAATRGRGIKICAHVILGLPGENRRHMLDTARTVAGMGIDGIKLHLLYIVRGTPLARLYRRGKYRCLEQDAYVQLVCDFLEHLPPDMIIQRLTSDPHREELVAPAWSLRKQETLSRIKAELTRRGTRQGSRFRGPASG
jgi:radical SAM protein (TIGR01212 family)